MSEPRESRHNGYYIIPGFPSYAINKSGEVMHITKEKKISLLRFPNGYYYFHLCLEFHQFLFELGWCLDIEN